jgi:hypothetical protein
MRQKNLNKFKSDLVSSLLSWFNNERITNLNLITE